jgi:VanZ family protein
MLKSFVMNQFLAICCALLIFTQSSIPGEKIPQIGFLSYDKVIHAGIYFVFAFALAHALRHQNWFPYLKEHWFVCTMLIAVLFAISDETHQLFVPKRAADIVDLNADVFGIIVALLIFRWFPTKPIGEPKNV